MTLTGFLKAQSSEQVEYFSRFTFGFYSGVNFESSFETGSDYLFEAKTNLGHFLRLKISGSYSTISKKESYTTRSYSIYKNNDRILYNASETDVEKKDYDIFSLSAGLQFVFPNQSKLEPYFLIEPFYNNFTNVRNVNAGRKFWQYYSLNEVPDEFKTDFKEIFPADSYGVALGIGTVYQLLKHINIDIRYFYRIDDKIINTHHFLAGIYF
jgi:opacity protein-like surface antigen